MPGRNGPECKPTDAINCPFVHLETMNLPPRLRWKPIQHIDLELKAGNMNKAIRSYNG